jgi:regulator of protease activity HflC (stomatin/prohibitin superfamily)
MNTSVIYFALIVAVAMTGLIFMFASLRKIPPDHSGVVLRLGRMVGELEPGNRWVLPYIDQVMLVDLREQTFPLPADLTFSADKQYAVKGQFTCKVIAPIPAVMAARQAQRDIIEVVGEKLVAELKRLGAAAVIGGPAYAQQQALETLNEQMSRAWQLKLTKIEFTLDPL